MSAAVRLACFMAAAEIRDSYVQLLREKDIFPVSAPILPQIDDFEPRGPLSVYGWLKAITKGKRTALLHCPNCYKVQSLQNHEIAPDGLVSPAVECNECEFTDTVRLGGWE